MTTFTYFYVDSSLLFAVIFPISCKITASKVFSFGVFFNSRLIFMKNVFFMILLSSSTSLSWITKIDWSKSQTLVNRFLERILFRKIFRLEISFFTSEYMKSHILDLWSFLRSIVYFISKISQFIHTSSLGHSIDYLLILLRDIQNIFWLVSINLSLVLSASQF